MLSVIDTGSSEVLANRKLILCVPLELEALQYTGATLPASAFVSFRQTPTNI